jgi:hypothetical protein
MKGEYMKKLLILLVLVILPVLTFADFQIGPTAMYNFIFNDPNLSGVTRALSLNDFTFGADARLNLGIFQGTAYALLTPGSVTGSGIDTVYNPTVIKLYTDVGLCLDFLIFRIGAGIGPNFKFNFADPAAPTKPDVFELGLNFRAAADISLGGIALSLVYLTDFNLTPAGAAKVFEKINGNLGLSLLFKLF